MAERPAPDPAAAESYSPFIGRDYAPDLIGAQALRFVRENKDKPFFLYYPTTVPHLALQVPEDSLQEYEGHFPEEPYLGDRGYLPQRTPRAAYAAMVTRMDRHIGQIIATIREAGLIDNTIFVFTSDNGLFYGEHRIAGGKVVPYEESVRMPLVISVPARLRHGAPRIPRITKPVAKS